jgi:DNA-binding transcriptional regulator YdaS (Cro superfamily)
MEKLLTYLNGLQPPEQADFAARCGTTVGYLRKTCSTRQRLGEGLCINIERESSGVVRCETIRPDVDWAYLRNSEPAEPLAQSERAQAAIETIAAEVSTSHGAWDGTERRVALEPVIPRSCESCVAEFINLSDEDQAALAARCLSCEKLPQTERPPVRINLFLTSSKTGHSSESSQ